MLFRSTNLIYFQKQIWKILADLQDSNYVFHPEIHNTAERPETIIWSHILKKFILLELACPAEEGIEAARIRKESKYKPLVESIASNTSWKPILLTLEIGTRGFIAISTHQVFLKIGLKRKQVSLLCRQLSETSARCSYTIYLAANSKIWDKDRPLLNDLD